jgi:two-component system response regulator QseB
MRANRLLLVEDDAELCVLLTETLTDEGYHVDRARDGQRGLHLGLSRPYDVMVIDRRLPALDGLDLVARLRSRAVPARVLMLTALGAVHDRVAGLDAGADDYLVKPFDLVELSARLRALCRRSPSPGGHLPVGTGRLDLAARDVVLAGGTRVALSAREFELLRVLAARPSGVHSRAELRRRVFDEASGASIVDTYVYYLRRKLGRAVIRTVHGLGYRMGAL